MAQGITVKGKTSADKNVALLVTDLGELYIARMQELIDAITASGGGKVTDGYGWQATSDDGTYKYFYFEDASLNYYIMRKHKTNKTFSYTKGTGGYSSVYVSSSAGPSGSPTWGTYGATF